LGGWYLINYKINQREVNVEIENKLISVSDILVKTEGNPKNWHDLDLPAETNRILSLGLCSKENLIESGKFSKLIKLDYIETKRILGIPRFQLFIGIYDSDGNLINLNGEDMQFGILPSDDITTYSITRLVVLENDGSRSFANLKVIIWR
jgi:hypothetical protein